MDNTVISTYFFDTEWLIKPVRLIFNTTNFKQHNFVYQKTKFFG